MSRDLGLSWRRSATRRAVRNCRAIQRWQLQDDPDAFEGIAKIKQIRGAIRRGVRLPAVVLVHTPERASFR
ncbi:hypothetical protein [Actinoplanes sp. NPDC089786]|uniref:hypothetical protein n=1 Tax=Actinoplanes sp. NPDC089786 TaxID=3155185 RepID=UPI00341EED96